MQEPQRGGAGAALLPLRGLLPQPKGPGRGPRQPEAPQPHGIGKGQPRAGQQNQHLQPQEPRGEARARQGLRGAADQAPNPSAGRYDRALCGGKVPAPGAG